MSRDEVFLRQDEAWDFVRSIADPTERLLAEIAVANALSFLVSDPDYQERFSSIPLDLLTFVRGVDAFLRNKDVLRRVLDGEVTHIDDLSPFPKDPPGQ